MITKEMTLEEIIRRYPQTIPIFHNFGLDCEECQLASYNSVKHCAEFHDVDIDVLIQELQRSISHQ